MSAYVVDDSTINRVIEFLVTRKDIGHIQHLLATSGYPLHQGLEPQKRLANDMASLNRQAVDHYSGEGTGQNGVPSFQYREEDPPTALQAYKSLQCWQYQCAEGDIPDSPLYKLMDEILNRLAHHLVMQSAAYDKAKWA